MGGLFSSCKQCQQHIPEENQIVISKIEEPQSSNTITTNPPSEQIEKVILTEKLSKLSTNRTQAPEQTKLTEKCCRCEDQNQGNIIKFCSQNDCQFHFHEACIIKKFDEQFKKQPLFLSCSCGTKIPIKYFRYTDIKEIQINSTRLLTEIFNNQVDFLMKDSQKLRHDLDVQKYYQQFKPQKNQIDVIFKPQINDLFKPGIIQIN